MKNAVVIALCATALAAHAAEKTYKHAADYKMATLDQTTHIGTFSQGIMTGNVYTDATASKSGVDAKVGHGGEGIHWLTTAEEGMYRVEAPVNTGKTIAHALLKNRYAPNVTIHNQWFMDKVTPGTKVLFAAECAAPNKKHPNDTVRCTFYFPDPDSTDHEYMTQGDFTPPVPGDGSNTDKVANGLCGTGKLNPAVEAELCKTGGAK